MTEGAAHGIKVNAIAPAAMTRMAGRSADETDELDRADASSAAMTPDLVAPMVAFLAHEDCPVSGEIYAAGGGRFARVFIAMTEGYVHRIAEPDDRRHRARTGPRSTTRPATPCPPTSWRGRPRS